MKTCKLLIYAFLALNTVYANDLEDKVDALIEEIESLKTSKTDGKLTSYTGLGKGLSKAYNSTEKISIGGYGHTDFTKKLDSTGSIMDNYRAILYLGYKFSETIIFNSEIEFEHANEVAVEFASLDFISNDYLNYRLGNFIVPVGLTNLQHEPTMYHTVSRPETERLIIPSTWHENGLMLYGKNSNLEYSLSLIAALDANKGSSIRSKRSSASKSPAEDLAAVIRIHYKPTNDFEFATSIYHGEEDQGTLTLQGVSSTIVHANAIYKVAGLEVTALYAQTYTANAQKVSLEHNSSTPTATRGFYINAAYKIGEWIPFVRYESFNTFLEGFDNTGTQQIANKPVIITALGVNYFPHPQVVLKADYLFYDDKGVQDNRIELGLGYLF